MSRISYSEDEDYPGQFELWQANCMRSIHGNKGKEELRILREALLALPQKRLTYGALVEPDGEVCAIGAYARHKGIDLSQFDPEDASDEAGVAAGMPAMAAWKIVEMNDFEFAHLTPERRYSKMLEWVEQQLV
jgi:hypothetical protein